MNKLTSAPKRMPRGTRNMLALLKDTYQRRLIKPTVWSRSILRTHRRLVKIWTLEGKQRRSRISPGTCLLSGCTDRGHTQPLRKSIRHIDWEKTLWISFKDRASGHKNSPRSESILQQSTPDTNANTKLSSHGRLRNVKIGNQESSKSAPTS